MPEETSDAETISAEDETWDQVKVNTPPAIVEAIAVQLKTAREARERIAREGSVVRQVNGTVVAHPAIKIEADAMKLYTAWLAKHGG